MRSFRQAEGGLSLRLLGGSAVTVAILGIIGTIWLTVAVTQARPMYSLNGHAAVVGVTWNDGCNDRASGLRLDLSRPPYVQRIDYTTLVYCAHAPNGS